MQRNYQLGFAPPDERGLFFQAWLYVEEEGAIVVVEHYSFLGQRAREEQQQGYSDHLFLPASSFEAVLQLIAQQCRCAVAPPLSVPTAPGEERVRLLFALLSQLKAAQHLGKASPLGQSHHTLRSWLEEVALPYEVVRSVWQRHLSSAEHVYIDGTKPGAVAQAIQALLAREKAPLPRKKQAAHHLVRRTRQDSGDSFSLSVTRDEAGDLIFHEEYAYRPHGDDEGREYHYYLTIPTTQVTAALQVFAQQGERDVPAEEVLADEALWECLRGLVARGLGGSERLTAAITTLQRWLNQAGIAYHLSRYVW